MNEILKNKYDLEERTVKFSESVIKICKTLNKDIITTPIISQLVRSSTSIGANVICLFWRQENRDKSFMERVSGINSYFF